MTVATNIVLADAQATPVNHTFVPIGLDKDGLFWFVDQSASNEIGFWKVSIQIRKPGMANPGESSANRTTRVKVTLHEPILETLSNNSAGYTPAPTVAYIPRQVTDYILHERATLQNRKDLRKMGYNLLNDANIVAVVENLAFLS